MVDVTPFLPGLSPVRGKAVVARFDGGRLSSEGGLLALREIERRLGLAERLAGCLKDPRMPEKVVHRLAEIIRFRMLMIAAGYEDGNDADTLRGDPMFKLALDRLPSGEELCSQSTISRLENLPDLRALLRLGRALVEQYCGSFRAVPKRVVLDIDDTFDRVHGGQQLRLFNAYYDDYGFQPIVVFDAEGRFVGALLRPGKRPSGVEIQAFLRRLIGAIRAHWPKVEILLRADSHYAAPEVFDWCRTNRVDWVLGLAPNAALSRHVAALEESTAARFKAAPTRGKVRRFMQFYDAAQSWSRVERIIARLEAGPEGTDTRFTWDYQEFRAQRGGSIDHAIAIVKRSPKRTANWDLAMDHSRGGMIHSFSERFKTKKRSLVAASSLGKWPRARTARRSLEFSASMAFVVYKIRRTSPGKA